MKRYQHHANYSYFGPFFSLCELCFYCLVGLGLMFHGKISQNYFNEGTLVRQIERTAANGKYAKLFSHASLTIRLHCCASNNIETRITMLSRQCSLLTTFMMIFSAPTICWSIASEFRQLMETKQMNLCKNHQPLCVSTNRIASFNRFAKIVSTFCVHEVFCVFY